MGKKERPTERWTEGGFVERGDLFRANE